jgi:hypothetical protein
MSDPERPSGLTLYTYLHENALHTNGELLRLPRPRLFSAYSFSGTRARNWTVFESLSDLEQGLSPHCLLHDGTNRTRPEPIVFRLPQPMHVSGVKEGCQGDPRPEPTPQKMENASGRTISTPLDQALLLSLSLLALSCNL